MIKMLGFDVQGLHDQGYDCVIVQVLINYKLPLVNGDRVRIDSNLEFKGELQTLFLQEMIRVSDNAVVADAKFVGCIITKDGPVAPDILKETKQKYLDMQQKKTSATGMDY